MTRDPSRITRTATLAGMPSRGQDHRPESVSRAELEARLADLPPAEAAAIRASVRVARPPAPATLNAGTPMPVYRSWSDYVAGTSAAERRAWCSRKARRANRERLMSGPPTERIGWHDVWLVMEAAQGRCMYCGSLAVEGRPSTPNGAPAPWEQVGRRVGSLSHVTARVDGGTNTLDNLGWACLWCNTWPSERVPGSTDRGAIA